MIFTTETRSVLGQPQAIVLLDGLHRATITHNPHGIGSPSSRDFTPPGWFVSFTRPKINGIRWRAPAHLDNGMVVGSLDAAIAAAEAELTAHA